jgi:S-adenosylmethionine-diacylgycerolhomoserine-N-methlytransferase
MDRVYRRQRYIYDLTRKYYLFGRDRMIRELALKPGESLIEIGCGTARNLVQIARRYPDARLFGLDASSEMLRTAAQNLARAGLSDRVQLAHGYAETLTPALFGRSEPFDRAVFSYSLSMIPDWRGALAAAAASLSAGGRLHAVDFADLAGLGPVPQQMLRGWLSLFHVQPRVEIVRELEACNFISDSEGDNALSLLPARYAFLWNCSRQAALSFCGNHVAPQSQAAENSPA